MRQERQHKQEKMENKDTFVFHRIEGREEVFIRQEGYPQYLFQVIEFESEAQLVKVISQTKDKLVRIMPTLVCLRFSGNIEHVNIGQDNYKEVLADIDRVRTAAALWYKEVSGIGL